jgi:hypothetical protein
MHVRTANDLRGTAKPGKAPAKPTPPKKGVKP